MTRAHTTVRMMAEGDESIHARGMAITALGLMRDPEDVPVLVDALSDPRVPITPRSRLRCSGRMRSSRSWRRDAAQRQMREGPRSRWCRRCPSPRTRRRCSR